MIVVVGEQEIHDTNYVVAVDSVQDVLLILNCRRNRPCAMHRFDAISLEHHFREVPGLPVMFHRSLRPGPLPVVR